MTFVDTSTVQPAVVNSPGAQTMFDVYSTAIKAQIIRAISGVGGARVSQLIGGVPSKFIEDWADAALLHATPELLESGEWYVSVEGVRGAWGEGDTPDDAMADLREALFGWAALGIERGDEIPVIGGIDLSPVRGEQAS